MALKSTLPGPSKRHSGDHIGKRKKVREATLNDQWWSRIASIVVKGRFGLFLVGSTLGLFLRPDKLAGPKLQAMTRPHQIIPRQVKRHMSFRTYQHVGCAVRDIHGKIAVTMMILLENWHSL